MTVCREQFCVVGRDRTIDQLDGVIRTPADGNLLAREHVNHFTQVFWQLNAEARHGW
jgi:hypothetical protein